MLTIPEFNIPGLSDTDRACIHAAAERGWVLEPDAKQILTGQGFEVPDSIVTKDPEKAAKFLAAVTGPVVIKAVSPLILHKTEYKAVVIGITEKGLLLQEMDRLLALEGCRAVLVEAMVPQGIELFVGAKNDVQFGPVVILGLGGTAVELYNDTAIRMAPIQSWDVTSMVDSLKAGQVLKGFRGGAGVNMPALIDLMVRFSHLAMALEETFVSMDLNPVICTPDNCMVVDARIMLKTKDAEFKK